MGKSEKIKWINGLKGIACLAVFMHHFIGSFYPATLYGTADPSMMAASGVDVTFSNRPWGFVINGNFAVTIFIIISAFLASSKIMKMRLNNQEIDFFNLGLKRYLRLMIPVAFWGIFYFLLMELCLAVNFNLSNFIPPVNFVNLLKHILFYQWITEDTNVIGPLWTMKALFLGVLIAMFVSLFASKKRWYSPFVLLLIAYALSKTYVYYGVACMGTFVADLYVHERVPQLVKFASDKKIKLNFLTGKVFRNVCGCLFILAGLLAGGYPTIVRPVDAIYSAMANVAVKIFAENPIAMIHAMGALFLILGLMMLTSNRLLSSKPFNWLGNISFGVYLIHPIVISAVSYWFVKVFADMSGLYWVGVWVGFALSLVTVFILAEFSRRVVEKWTPLRRKAN